MSLTQKLKILQLDLEYEFNNSLLIEEALTHSSSDLNYNNERLEFLGDRVLGLVVAKILLDEFPLDNEGDIGRRFSQLVMGDTLTDIAYRIGLDKLIILRGVKVNNNIMADTMEAVIASLYLDGGFSVAEKFIYKYWEPLVKMLDVPPKDSKTTLQELSQSKGAGLPIYSETFREGPDHDPIFTVEVCIPLVGTSTARGNNKQSAEQKAAQNLLFELGIINDNKTY
jgi:ribonuclease-3